MKINKEQLKPLIKMVLTEMARRRSGASGEYEDYEIELDNLAIPGVCEAGDYVLITTTIEYSADPGYPDRGMYGPPEHSEQGEGASVEIQDQYATAIKVVNAAEQEMEYDPTTLTPEQQKIVAVVVEKYVNDNISDIEEKILNTIDFDSEPDYEPDEPDDDRDRHDNYWGP
jgi:hypothetical protein